MSSLAVLPLKKLSSTHKKSKRLNILCGRAQSKTLWCSFFVGSREVEQCEKFSLFEWKLAVGEVVINRADSPEFPDTIKEVIHAEGQYANANTDYFKNLTPFEPCVEAAARLLSGERVLNEPSVVFQSGGVQGSGVYLELYSSYYGYTYLCYSSYPELYGG